MTTCTYTDSFRLEADFDYTEEDYGVVSSPDGCYEEPIYFPVESGEAANYFVSDGDISDYEYYFRTEYLHEFDDLGDDLGDSDDVEVWIIATYRDDTYNTRCIDYFLNDYTLLHPTEVSYWACEDDEDGYAYNDLAATISTICGCHTPAPIAAPTTPSPLATAGPTSDSLTPALTTTFSPTRAPEVASSPHPVSTASDEAAPAGEVAGWVVAGLVVVVAVVLAALCKTGRLKIKRTGKQPSHDDVASGSGFTGNTPPAASEAPVPHQYPVAFQYPEAVQ